MAVQGEDTRQGILRPSGLGRRRVAFIEVAGEDHRMRCIREWRLHSVHWRFL